MESEEEVAVADAPRPLRIEWTRLIIIALAALLAMVLFARLVLHWPDGGKYARLGQDHDDLMVADAPNASRTLTIMFVGNSLTSVNDLPAMLIDIASSDPDVPVRLQAKAFTKGGATLIGIFEDTNALAWAQSHPVDEVVLQEISHWYATEDAVHASSYGYDATLGSAQRWVDALRPLGATPVLFQVWADADDSVAYTDKSWATFGWTSARDATESLRSTERLATRIGTPVAPVGEAFDTASRTPGAPDVWGPDRHHPSVAGTYLAALVFYRQFTGRTGAEATWRPNGLSADDAAKLQRIAGG